MLLARDIYQIHVLRFGNITELFSLVIKLSYHWIMYVVCIHELTMYVRADAVAVKTSASLSLQFEVPMFESGDLVPQVRDLDVQLARRYTISAQLLLLGAQLVVQLVTQTRVRHVWFTLATGAGRGHSRGVVTSVVL